MVLCVWGVTEDAKVDRSNRCVGVCVQNIDKVVPHRGDSTVLMNTEMICREIQCRLQVICHAKIYL